ncbi:MAG: haloacid dehalogenase-like hydrolase [Clostridia bacterium]|nr:haloacid dehalogenase-like hydrolase [Clostridia bacterium]
MANIIAVIWDCDKTLIDGYMQDPIFEEYGVDAAAFWREVHTAAEEYTKHNVRVNRDTYYLNHFIKRAHDGTFKGLNNQKLREYGQKQVFYNGVAELFKHTKTMFQDDKSYTEYGIQVEHYIVSTGFAEVIRGSGLARYVDGIWGCELADGPDPNGDPVISEILYTIDNTSKTRALFEINKGAEIDVNSRIPEEHRRVHFENMIYIADGPSDIPAFSVVKQNGGATFAIYPKGDMDAMQQVERMRADGRVDMYAEADYSENTTAYMWITNQIRRMAQRIRDTEKTKIRNSASGTPKHLV